MNFNVNIDTKEEMAATSATMDPAGNGEELPEHSGSGGTPNPDLMSKEKSNPKESGSSSTQSKTPGGEGLTDGGAHGDKAKEDEWHAEEKKLEKIAKQKEEKKKEQQARGKIAETLWPTDQRFKEFTAGTGQDPNKEKHVLVAHLLNQEGWMKEYKKYMEMPASSKSTSQLNVCRKEAIAVSLTKAKKTELRHIREKEEADAREENKKRKAAGSQGGGSNNKGKGTAGGSKSAPNTKSSGQAKGSSKSATPSSSRDRDAMPPPRGAANRSRRGGSPSGSSGSQKSGRSSDATRPRSPHNIQHGRGGSSQSVDRHSTLRSGSVKDRLGPRPLDTDKRPRQSESETDSETRGRRKTRRNSEDSHDMEHDDEIVINTQQHEEFEEGSEHDSDGYQSDRTEGTSDRGDNNDDEDDNTGDNPSYRKVAKPPGEWRVIVTAKDGDTVTLDREFFKKFQTRFSAAVSEQQQDLEVDPILINEFWFFGGRIIIEPADEESMGLAIELVTDKVEIGGHKLEAKAAKDLPKSATVVWKVESQGRAEDLLLCPRGGVARLNKWRLKNKPGIRILNPVKQTTGTRFIRTSVTEEVVGLLKLADGMVYCGAGRASVHWQKKPLRKDTEVVCSEPF